MTEKEAIELANKVMKDINFGFDESAHIQLNFIDNSDSIVFPDNSWLVSFPYGEEDYGRNVSAHLTILDDNEIATEISFRNGAIDLGYDEENDKYFVKERRP